jgi:hypothetical protein
MADGASHRTRTEPGTEGDAFGLESSASGSAPDRLSFGVIDPADTRPGAPRSRFPWLAVAFFLAALVAVATLRSVWLRSLLPLALALGGALVLFRYRARTPRAGTRDTPRAPRALVLDSTGLSYELVRRAVPGVPPPVVRRDEAPLPLLDGSQRFGATLLSNATRDKLALAITSGQGTFLVGTRLTEEDKRDFADLFARSSVLGSDESALDATGPDGKPVCLPPDAFKKLYGSLVALDPGSASRIVLSDQRGNPLELEGTTLLVRGTRFDLARPLEWRAIVFQEPFGHAINLYQGTWVRQGPHEIVLVALMTPSLFETTLRGPTTDGARVALDKLAQRDQRLVQAAAADPPAIESRIAIDGLFVVPIRAALDGSPRPSSEESRRTRLAT